jgi:hypothetical protein
MPKQNRLVSMTPFVLSVANHPQASTPGARRPSGLFSSTCLALICMFSLLLAKAGGRAPRLQALLQWFPALACRIDQLRFWLQILNNRILPEPAAPSSHTYSCGVP